MTLDLRRIFANDNSSIDINGSIDMSDVDIAAGFPLKKPVSYCGSVANNASVATLNLTIDYEYSAPCDRCGNLTSKRHSVTIEKSPSLRFLPHFWHRPLQSPLHKCLLGKLRITSEYTNSSTSSRISDTTIIVSLSCLSKEVASDFSIVTL